MSSSASEPAAAHSSSPARYSNSILPPSEFCGNDASDRYICNCSIDRRPSAGSVANPSKTSVCGPLQARSRIAEFWSENFLMPEFSPRSSLSAFSLPVQAESKPSGEVAAFAGNNRRGSFFAGFSSVKAAASSIIGASSVVDEVSFWDWPDAGSDSGAPLFKNGARQIPLLADSGFSCEQSKTAPFSPGVSAVSVSGVAGGSVSLFAVSLVSVASSAGALFSAALSVLGVASDSGSGAGSGVSVGVGSGADTGAGSGAGASAAGAGAATSPVAPASCARMFFAGKTRIAAIASKTKKPVRAATLFLIIRWQKKFFNTKKPLAIH